MKIKIKEVLSFLKTIHFRLSTADTKQSFYVMWCHSFPWVSTVFLFFCFKTSSANVSNHLSSETVLGILLFSELLKFLDRLFLACFMIFEMKCVTMTTASLFNIRGNLGSDTWQSGGPLYHLPVNQCSWQSRFFLLMPAFFNTLLMLLRGIGDFNFPTEC